MPSETFTFYVQPWYRKSPYHEAAKRHGCRSWGVYNHMLLPTLYDDPVTEYRALTKDVTLWDVAVERIVEISGRTPGSSPTCSRVAISPRARSASASTPSSPPAVEAS
jgi:hypothetical protein